MSQNFEHQADRHQDCMNQAAAKNSKQPATFAPRHIFNQILAWSVIPTFDLVIAYGNQGIIIVKRTIAPYKNQWALPGLRMYKGESIEGTISRIARQELGLTIDPRKRTFLGQYVGRFRTERNRQDISTGYYLEIPDKQPVILNREHFSQYKTVNNAPKNMGAMYRFYIAQCKKMNR